MKKTTEAKIKNMGRGIVRAIETGIALGLVQPETPDEKPTPGNIKRLTRAVARRQGGAPSVFKTKEQYDMLDAYVYQRLRRDGALKALRGLTAGA